MSQDEFTALNSGFPIEICDDPNDAIRRGYVYREPVFKPLKLSRIIVVKGGTQEGNSTVDIVLEDDKGQKYVTLATSALIKMIPAFGPGNTRPPISDEAFNIMWTNALGRVIEGNAGRIQAMHFLKLIEQYYGINHA